MDDDLIDDDALSLSRKSVLPGTGFFYPDSLDDARADERVREAVAGADAVVIADGDADGLGCVALVREAYDAALDVASFEASIAARTADGDADADANADAEADVGANTETEADAAVDAGEETDADGDAGGETAEADGSPVALVAAGPYSLDRALERVAAYADPGVDVYVCDIAPDAYDPIEAPLAALVDRAATVRWFDHHQWGDDVAAAVRDAGVDLAVGDSEEECSTDVTLRSLDREFSERFRELAAVTRDHDLWLKRDARSDDLADYAHWSDPEEYVTVVGAYGPDLPAAVEEFLAARRVEKQSLIDRAVDRAELREVGPWTVGVTYGRCSQNEVADALREDGADASVIVKPAGSASIRGSASFERCHEVAELVDGGGHPKAAGCKPDVYDDMLDYAHHWTTRGATTKRVIVEAFERVAHEAADAADAADAGGDAEADE